MPLFAYFSFPANSALSLAVVLLDDASVLNACPLQSSLNTSRVAKRHEKPQCICLSIM
jgi:hypothetical protein